MRRKSITTLIVKDLLFYISLIFTLLALYHYFGSKVNNVKLSKSDIVIEYIFDKSLIYIEKVETYLFDDSE